MEPGDFSREGATIRVLKACDGVSLGESKPITQTIGTMTATAVTPPQQQRRRNTAAAVWAAATAA